MGEDFHKLETLIFSLFNSFTRTTKKKKNNMITYWEKMPIQIHISKEQQHPNTSDLFKLKKKIVFSYFG